MNVNIHITSITGLRPDLDVCCIQNFHEQPWRLFYRGKYMCNCTEIPALISLEMNTVFPSFIERPLSI
jgi:hypothetical protein